MLELVKLRRDLNWALGKIRCLIKRDCECQADCNQYSTTETIIGKWVDGRSIYRKVIFLEWNTGLPDDNFWDIAGFLRRIPVNESGVDFFTRVDGRMYANEDTITVNFGKLIYDVSPSSSAPYVGHVDSLGVLNAPFLSLNKNNFLNPPSPDVIKFTFILEYVKP